MKVLVKRVDKSSEVIEINGSLKSMQDLVGGYIEIVILWSVLGFKKCDYLLVCNEEGMLKGLMPQGIGDRVYFGDVFFCRSEGADMVGLNDEDIEKIRIVLKV